jgi:NitT/TauT family transport system substrate-binding protein
LAAAFVVALLAGVRPGTAEGITVRISRPVDLIALPLLVMEREHLIERRAEAMGIAGVAVTWSASNDTGAIESLAAGASDLVAADLVPFLIAADATAGTPGEVRGIAALAQRPYVLVARNPAIKTIRDFRAKDRIAVPALKVSGRALMLELAAAQEWGAEHYDKLDPLVVARQDPAATEALLAGRGDIDAHFSRSPYVDAELADPAIHRVMDSFDIAGPHSAAVLATTSRFRDANPELCKAILSALEEADDLITKNPGEAAEIYGGLEQDQKIPLEALTDMIGDPDLAYAAAPAGVMRLADFMQRVGRLKRRPNSWRELFLPESRDLAGN